MKEGTRSSIVALENARREIFRDSVEETSINNFIREAALRRVPSSIVTI
jgi:hypothetical protein